MRHIRHRNVNRAYPHAMDTILREGQEEETRNGTAWVHPLPFTTTYTKPWERVLFHKARNANPFFHLFEAFWMLAGRADARFLNTYVKDFGDRFAEPDGFLWGAYGRRWRSWFDDIGGARNLDQIEKAVDLFTASPYTRQVVISMWDPKWDLGAKRQDIPCNTTIYLRTRPSPDSIPGLLTTVCCRSNDAIWGCYGANAVHFSIFHEYMSYRIGARMAEMMQISNNLHAYNNTLQLYDPKEEDCDRYSRGEVEWRPLFHSAMDATAFHVDLDKWLNDPVDERNEQYLPVFTELLVPMAQVHALYSNRQWDDAVTACEFIQHSDWREAALLWLTRHRRS